MNTPQNDAEIKEILRKQIALLAEESKKHISEIISAISRVFFFRHPFVYGFAYRFYEFNYCRSIRIIVFFLHRRARFARTHIVVVLYTDLYAANIGITVGSVSTESVLDFLRRNADHKVVFFLIAVSGITKLPAAVKFSVVLLVFLFREKSAYAVMLSESVDGKKHRPVGIPRASAITEHSVVIIGSRLVLRARSP